MGYLNKTMIIGKLGGEPEMRFTSSGQAVTNFSVAVNYKDETTWFRVNAWGKQAEHCNEYLSKGDQVYVEGRVAQKEWEGQDGQSHYNLELSANQVIFLGYYAVDGEPTEETEIENAPF